MPAELNPLVGRRKESNEVFQRLSHGRLVTLVGVGGVGKTRLALRVAHRARTLFPGGVFMVELAEVQEADLVLPTIIDSVSAVGAASLDALARRVGEERILLVLDNCEHVAPAVARFADSALQACPNLQMLLTSREPIHTLGETIYIVPPLSVPDELSVVGPREATTFGAVALFCARAKETANFELTSDVLPLVASLCRRLDGLPLALELAAIGLRTMSLADILEQYERHFELVSERSPSIPVRHQTIRAALEWSYALCSEAERILWQRLAVFAGGFDLRAAEQVAGTAPLGAADVLDDLRGLVDKSIVSFDGLQYRMLETIRRYGLQLLRPTPDYLETRDRHCAYVAALGDRFRHRWFGSDQMAILAEVRRHQSDIRSALEWCRSSPERTHTGLRLASALWIHWLAGGLGLEGRRWLDQLLAEGPPGDPERISALWVRAYLAVVSGSIDAAVADLRDCLRLAEQSGDAAGQAHATHVLGLARLLYDDDVDEAIVVLRSAVDLERQVEGSDPFVAVALVSLGAALSSDDQLDQAIAVFSEARSICEASGERWLLSWIIAFLGVAEWRLGRSLQAVAMLRDALEAKWRLQDVVGAAHSLEFLGWATLSAGDLESAAVLLAGSRKHFHPFGAHLVGWKRLQRWSEAAIESTRSGLGHARFDQATKRGGSMTLPELVTLAVEQSTDAGSTDSATVVPWGVLTRRETEVARLVALGLTNRDIADRLVISNRTVDCHVDHILTKLGLNSRTAVAVLITQDGSGRESAL